MRWLNSNLSWGETPGWRPRQTVWSASSVKFRFSPRWVGWNYELRYSSCQLLFITCLAPYLYSPNCEIRFARNQKGWVWWFYSFKGYIYIVNCWVSEQISVRRTYRKRLNALFKPYNFVESGYNELKTAPVSFAFLPPQPPRRTPFLFFNELPISSLASQTFPISEKLNTEPDPN